MKVRSFPLPRLLLATLAQVRALLREFWIQFRNQRLLGLGFLTFAFGLGMLVLPYDNRILRSLHFWGHSETIARNISYALGTWGDYPTYNVPLAILIWIYGAWKKSTAWRRIAVVCFLGATLAGLFDDFFRLSLGRPRPDAHVMDGFYGFGYAFQSRYQSFPSGHAAAVFGTAVSLLMVHRGLGLVTTLYAITVVWARMELNRHYPSDVVVGSMIGIYFGVMVGLAARGRLWTPPVAPPATADSAPE